VSVALQAYQLPLACGEIIMKKIEAVISSDAAEDVLELLDRRAISNFSLSNIMAKDSLGPHIQTYRGHAYAVDLSPEVKFEAVVPDNQVMATAYAILDAARGPGRSFKPRVIITPVAEVIMEIRDLTSSDAGDPESSHDREKKEVHHDTRAGLALTDMAPQTSAGTPPVHLAKRITVILANYLRGARANVAATWARTSFPTSPRVTRNPASRVTLANNTSLP
jgi:nitrogen regulatory protein PII